LEFEIKGIEYKRRVKVDVINKGKVIKGQRLDILVEDQVFVELKAVTKVPDVALAQTLSYLKATGVPVPYR